MSSNKESCEKILDNYKYGNSGLEKAIKSVMSQFCIDYCNTSASDQISEILYDYNWKHKSREETLVELMEVGTKHGYTLACDDPFPEPILSTQVPAKSLSATPIRSSGLISPPISTDSRQKILAELKLSGHVNGMVHFGLEYQVRIGSPVGSKVTVYKLSNYSSVGSSPVSLNIKVRPFSPSIGSEKVIAREIAKEIQKVYKDQQANPNSRKVQPGIVLKYLNGSLISIDSNPNYSGSP